MAQTTPKVRDETLAWHVAGKDHVIPIGSPAWFDWLDSATSFAYQGACGHFTARKERRQRGGWYWKAYRKHNGKLRRAYLGKSAELTPARLAATAAALAPAEVNSGQPPDRSARDLMAEPLPTADERPVPLLPSLHPAAAQADHAAPVSWPRGTVTFLLADIVDSTQLWERYPQVMPQVLVRYDALVHRAVAAHGGVVFKTLGDTVYAAFARAPNALAAAYITQHALRAESWAALGLAPEAPVQVRVALHTGAADTRNGDYLGPPLNRASRILAASHGGQILLSYAAGALVNDALPDGVSLRDLGTYQLKGLHGTGLSRVERLFQVVSSDLPIEFPPPISAASAPAGALPLHPLLATKILPPPRADLAPRPRLIERLRRVTEHQLTLVVAPPGFGKTTLLSAWLHQLSGRGGEGGRPNAPHAAFVARSVEVAWLTLDEADNDPVRFWSYLIAALEQQRPGVAADAAGLLRGAQAVPIDTVLTVLVNAIAAAPGALVLVLDDYHVISAAPIHQALATLIAYLPPNFHLVIASRADVAFPLARLRARGQVAEIRTADLRCTPDEAAALLRAMLGRDLAPDAIATLLERTEGWIAGLQLAALSLQGEADVAGLVAAIRGDNRYIWEYLVDEVLDQQPPAVRQFLLATSLLDRMCAELCDAVVGVSDAKAPAAQSQAMLEHLERANLFLVPLDIERRWYRYHRLFTDVLRLRVRQLHPEQIPLVHRRAAAWYRTNGLAADAIQHLLAAQDWPEAAAAIEGSAEELLMHGEMATLAGWVKALAPDALERRPRLCLFYTASLVTLGRLDEADHYMSIAEAAGKNLPPGSAGALQPGELDTVRAVVTGSRGDLSRSMAFAQAALAQLPPGRNLFRLAATMVLGSYSWMRGENNQTLQFIEEQLRLDDSGGTELLHAWVYTLLIYVQFAQGKLRLASQTCWRLLAPNDHGGSSTLLIAGAAAARLSEISYEWNDLDAAARFAREGIAQSQRLGSPEQEAFCLAALAIALQAQGDADSARTAIERAARLVQPQPIERAVVAAYGARLWLAQGDLALALAWARACTPRTLETIAYLRVIEQLTQARVYIAQGGAQVAQAIGLLVPLLRDAETQEQFGQAIEALALLALAHATAGDRDQALAALARALALGAPESYIRMFVDLGAPMQALIAEYRSQLAHRSGDLLAYADKLLAAFPQSGAHATSAPTLSERSIMVEQLSLRELEVLRLIAAGQSTATIARTLIIAESTVKMHLKNIYGKLDAHSRTQAVARAHALGFLQ